VAAKNLIRQQISSAGKWLTYGQNSRLNKSPIHNSSLVLNLLSGPTALAKTRMLQIFGFTY